MSDFMTIAGVTVDSPWAHRKDMCGAVILSPAHRRFFPPHILDLDEDFVPLIAELSLFVQEVLQLAHFCTEAIAARTSSSNA